MVIFPWPVTNELRLMICFAALIAVYPDVNPLHGLAAGTLVAAARERADAEYQLAFRDADRTLERTALEDMFGFTTRFPRSFRAYLERCEPHHFSSFIKDYGTFPVTAVITPEQ